MFLMKIEKEKGNGALASAEHGDMVGGFLDLHIHAESQDQ
jgi:hypothetical protein